MTDLYNNGSMKGQDNQSLPSDLTIFITRESFQVIRFYSFVKNSMWVEDTSFQRLYDVISMVHLRMSLNIFDIHSYLNPMLNEIHSDVMSDSVKAKIYIYARLSKGETSCRRLILLK